jgi:uncharacterized membrane protein (TIGR02234 family)
VTARREALAAFVGALFAALLLLLAVAQNWATGTARLQQGLIVVSEHVSGRTAAPLVAAAGIVALAGAAAIPATRGLGRRIAGVALVAGGIAAAVDALLRRNTAQDDVRGKLPAGASVSGSGWAYVAFAGGLLLLAVGVVLVARGHRWASLSARYEGAAARQDAASTRLDTDVAAWDALDRGEDPTQRPENASP